MKLPFAPHRWSLSLALLSLFVALTGIAEGQDFATFARNNSIPVYELEIVSTIPHSTDSYTQGLVYENGILYESTGLYGQSTLQKLDATTGEVLASRPLAPDLFAEGLTSCHDELFQITWQERTALVYSRETLDLVRTLAYDGEGWGLTSNGDRLIMSDGSYLLYFRDPSDLSLLDTVAVTLAGRRPRGINELEFAHGHVYANVLGSDEILEIDPESGSVTGVVDAASLRDQIAATLLEKPLNGIAYDAASGDFFLTGKLWPAIYRVRFVRSMGR